VLILGIIQTLIVFDGTLSSWWTRIAIGALLLLFCLLQRLFEKEATHMMRTVWNIAGWPRGRCHHARNGRRAAG